VDLVHEFGYTRRAERVLIRPTHGDGNVPIAYHIREGDYGDVHLDDLTAVCVIIVPGPGPMPDGNQKMGLYSDARATSGRTPAFSKSAVTVAQHDARGIPDTRTPVVPICRRREASAGYSRIMVMPGTKRVRMGITS
jgi:hypothetical protein